MTQPSPVQFTYIDPDGGSWLLSDNLLSQGYVCTGISGIAGLPVAFSTIPLIDGGVAPQLYIPQPGNVNMGLYIEALNGDQNSYMNLLDKLTYAFYNRRNGSPAPGFLQGQRPDGTSRQLALFCTSGLDQPSASSSDDGLQTGQLWTTYVLTFQSPDPFWYDVNTQQIVFGLAGAPTGILPLLPIALGLSTVLGTATVHNDAGAESYPYWDITGPGIPVIKNNSTGRSFSMGSSLASGQTVRVTTQPGQQSVVDLSTGANLWSNLVAASPRDLWPIIVGSNSLTLTMSGAGTGSQIVMNWTKRWLRV